MNMRHVLITCVLLASTVQAQQQPRVYIQASETVDASNSSNKSRQVDFGSALTAALAKKDVPVVVVTDQTKAQWVIKSTSSQQEDSTGTKVAKMAFCGILCGGYTKFEGTIQVVDIDSSAVLFAYNVKKSNFQSAAEAFAKHFKDDYLQHRHQ
jgi:hypothetical protein